MRRITKSYYNYFHSKKIGLLKSRTNSVCRSYGSVNDREDLLSIAENQLLYSMINFDMSKGSFNTYLYHRVNGTLRHFVQNKIRLKMIQDRQISLSKNYCRDNTENRMFIDEMLSSLNEDESTILTMRYLNSNTLEEISKVVKFSICKVMKISNRAIVKLQKTFSV